MRQPPQSTVPSRSTGPRSSQSRSYSRTACSPPPRSTRREPASESSSSASGGGSVRRGLERPEQVLARAGMDALEERQHLVPDQPADGGRIRRVGAPLEPALPAVGLGLLAPEAQQRAHDPVLAPDLDPLAPDRSRRGDTAPSRPGRRACARSRGERRRGTSSARLVGRPRSRSARLPARPRRRTARHTSAHPRRTRPRAGRGRHAEQTRR